MADGLTATDLRRVLDLSRELLAVFELDGSIRFLSPAWRDILGQDPSGADATSLGALVHPDDRERVGQQLQADLAAGREHGTFMVRMVTFDGGERCVDWTWQLDRIRSLFFALGRDITAETTATEGRRSAEARFAALIDRMADPSLGLDREGRIVYVNDAAASDIGRSREDLVGRVLWGAPDAIGTEFEDEYRAALADGRPRHFEAFVQSSERWVEVRAVPDAEGLGIAYRDVSGRHDLEAQLRQSQKMEAIGRLAGGVAHDFNNLLTAIMGYGELLADSPLDPDSQASVAAIRRAAERAATLTGQLLAFGRRQILKPAILDANEVVGGIDSLVRRLVGEDVRLVTLAAPGSVRVRADASQLDQILVNLVVNARDAMPAGGSLTIEVAPVELDETYAATHPEVVPGQYVMLAVSDTGTGMTPQTQAQIFEPFFTTKGPGLGTGLGLSTVFGIVKQSGGSIGVYSEPGRGTVFKVYLPRVFEGPDETVGSGPEPINLEGSETILLAEDEETVRDITIMALRRHGYQLLVAGSGEEALELAAEHPGPIHLLITDVVMRGISGRELADAMVLDRPLIRTLYVSGYTENTIVHHGVLEPGIAFLAKPFTPVQLARRVREVLA